MRYPAIRFKSLELALKELEPFIKNGQHLRTGKPFNRFGRMRSREMLANWLLCVTLNAVDGRRLTFFSDPIGGDGIIQDEANGQTWATEHVCVLQNNSGVNPVVETLILEAIEKKRSKGAAAYASGKTLIIFIDAGAGEWFPNRISRNLPSPLYFEAVWVVGLQSVKNGSYIYGVTLLDASKGMAPIYLISISTDFSAWKVNEIQ